MTNAQAVSAYDMIDAIKEAIVNDVDAIEAMSGISIDNDTDMNDALDEVDANINALPDDSLYSLYNAVMAHKDDASYKINWNAYRAQ